MAKPAYAIEVTGEDARLIRVVSEKRGLSADEWVRRAIWFSLRSAKTVDGLDLNDALNAASAPYDWKAAFSMLDRVCGPDAPKQEAIRVCDEVVMFCRLLMDKAEQVRLKASNRGK